MIVQEGTLSIACDMKAIPRSRRDQHLATTAELFRSVKEIRELPNGYSFRLANETSLLLHAAEFISLERLCCPFFKFTLEVTGNGGPVWLSLTDGDGIKTFLQCEIGPHLVAPLKF